MRSTFRPHAEMGLAVPPLVSMGGHACPLLASWIQAPRVSAAFPPSWQGDLRHLCSCASPPAKANWYFRRGVGMDTRADKHGASTEQRGARAEALARHEAL